MLPHILPLIPKHSCYVEPFFGGGAVYFAKEPSSLEIINDTNAEVTNFYFCLKVHFKELNTLVQATLHSRETHKEAKVVYEFPHLFDRVRRAWAFWVLTSQGFAGKIGSWGFDKSAPNKTTKTINNKKVQFGEHLTERLSVTQIECDDAVRLIKSRDREDVFMFIDPPYFNSNCGHYGGYTERDFQDLLEVLSGLKGRFLLSSYHSEVLERFTKSSKWHQTSFNKQLSAAKQGKRKIEVLTANYQIE